MNLVNLRLQCRVQLEQLIHLHTQLFNLVRLLPQVPHNVMLAPLQISGAALSEAHLLLHLILRLSAYRAVNISLTRLHFVIQLCLLFLESLIEALKLLAN